MILAMPKLTADGLKRLGHQRNFFEKAEKFLDENFENFVENFIAEIFRSQEFSSLLNIFISVSQNRFPTIEIGHNCDFEAKEA